MFSDGNPEVRETSCNLVDAENIPAESLQAALMLLSRSCAPCPEDVLRIELGVLMATTAGRKDDAEMVVRIYSRALQDYPADCAMAAIRYAQKHSRFWPTLADLISDTEWRCISRKNKLRAVQQEITHRGANQ